MLEMLKQKTSKKQFDYSTFFTEKKLASNFKAEDKKLLKELKKIKGKCLVFSDHPDTVKILHKNKDFKNDSLLVTSDVKRNKRQEIVNEFNTSSDKKYLFMTIRVGNTGFDVFVPNIMLIDLSLVPAENKQAIGRIKRMNAKYRSINIYQVIASETDAKVQKILLSKINEKNIIEGNEK